MKPHGTNLDSVVAMARTPEEGPADAWQRTEGAQRLQKMVQRALPGAQVVRVVALKPDAAPSADENVKGGGYGAPLRLDVIHEGKPLSLVLHVVTSNQFGHDRRADRACELLLAADTFGTIPRHVGVLDVGSGRERSRPCAVGAHHRAVSRRARPVRS